MHALKTLQSHQREQREVKKHLTWAANAAAARNMLNAGQSYFCLRKFDLTFSSADRSHQSSSHMKNTMKWPRELFKWKKDACRDGRNPECRKKTTKKLKKRWKREARRSVKAQSCVDPYGIESRYKLATTIGSRGPAIAMSRDLGSVDKESAG